MPINIPVAIDIKQQSLYQLLAEILRRALDVSINPAQINVQLNITGNDLKIVTPQNGVQIAASNGSGNFYRLTVQEVTGEDGSPYGVLTISKV